MGARYMNIIESNLRTSVPLESCLLVDYRLSSRTRLKEYIHSTQLFETVHEPGSLTIGLEMVASQQIETCIFGPSVKPEKINEFILNTQISGLSTKCAFLAFQSRERGGTVFGAHAVLEFPCPQPNFNIGIVKALAGANGGKIPESKRTNPITGKPISLKASLAQLEFPGHERKVPIAAERVTEGPLPPAQPWSGELIKVVVQNIPELFDKLGQIQPFNLKFRSNGTPTEFTSNILRDVIETTFNNMISIPDIEPFKEALQTLLLGWVKRGTTQGRAAADFVLRRELRDCLESE